MTEQDVWTRQAEQWTRVGAPLRPGPDDQAILQAVVDARSAAPRVLVLGVTPELVQLDWPDGTDLIAADKSADMIRDVFPGFAGSKDGAMLADWRDLPLADHSRDLVIGDGCFNVMDHPVGQSAVFRTAHRVLVSGGDLVFRLFAHPDTGERPAEVIDAAMAGEIESFHAFKLRLLMAVQPSSQSGVAVRDVFDAWTAHTPGVEAMSARCGWPEAQVRTIEAYEGNATTLCFPRRAEVEALGEHAGFVLESVAHGSYELGERCPTLHMRAR